MDADKRYIQLEKILKEYEDDEISLLDDLSCLLPNELGQTASVLYIRKLLGLE